ncbi:hypothetical protein LCGC14_2671120, partial [marine sediment metagenome]
MKEEWRPMFDNQYEISSHGRVRRGRVRRGRVFVHGSYEGRLMQPVLNFHGYLRLTISAYNKSLTFTVHALVAWAFLGPRPLKKQINHKDGNKQNNHANNLEYVTARENIRHAVALGLTARG